MKNKKQASRIIMVFSAVLIVMFVAAGVFVSGNWEEDRAQENESPTIINVSDPVEIIISKGYSFEYKKDEWKVLPQKTGFDIQLESTSSGAILTIISTRSEESNLEDFVVSQKESLTKLFPNLLILSEEFITLNDHRIFKFNIEFSTKVDSPKTTQSRYMTISNGENIKFIYSHPNGLEGDFSEFDEFIKSVSF